MSTRTLLAKVGSVEAIRIIRANHAVETMKSPTYRKELHKQLSNPKAGASAHLESCNSCTSAIKTRAEEFERISLSSLSAPMATTAALA